MVDGTRASRLDVVFLDDWSAVVVCDRGVFCLVVCMDLCE